MVERTEIKAIYNKIAPIYKEEIVDTEYFSEPIETVELFNDSLTDDSIILDVGCGNNPLQPNDIHQSIGLDISENQLQTAETDSGLVQGDMVALPFQDDSFTHLTAFFSVIHIPQEYHQQVWNEFMRVLKSDGLALVTEGGERWEGSNENWLDRGIEMKWDIAGPQQTAEYLSNAGFSVQTKEVVVDPESDDGSGYRYYFIST
jgi:ubiquinone/menaquinone biosynthesis C-methylase UbiE